MVFLDYLLQFHRTRRVARHVDDNDVVLDFGCYQGEFLKLIENQIQAGFGIDKNISSRSSLNESENSKIRLLKGNVDHIRRLPRDFQPTLIVAIAVLEHLSDCEILSFGTSIREISTQNARLIITMPHPFVDNLIKFLKRLRLLDGMDDDAHHELGIEIVIQLLKKTNWRMIYWKKFQFGLNNEIHFVKSLT